MARIPRVVVPNQPHHVTQRGNFSQTVFEDDEDRERYLECLGTYSRYYSTRIWAYCLMGTHVHMIVVPEKEDSLARTLRRSQGQYSLYLNQKLGRSGHVWQARFYSAVLCEEHLYAAVRYVEKNPVRAGLVSNPADYRWSSAQSHITGAEDPLISKDCPLIKSIPDWSAFLDLPDDGKSLETIRSSSRTGRPAGDKSFVASIEVLVGRELRLKRGGRPRIDPEGRIHGKTR